MVNNYSSIQTNRTAKSLKEIADIDVFDKQTGQVKDMNTILSEVAEKYKTLSKNQKLALAEAIGGKTQINSVQALLNNWNQVAKFQREYLNGDMVGSAAKENERYLDSIEGRMAKLKNSWDKLVTSLASSGAVKFGISGLDAGVSSIEKIVSALDKAHMTIPAAVASFALLKTAISSIKYAGGLTDGISMFVMKIGEIPAAVGKAVSALTALTGLSTGGLVLALGGVAAAIAAVYAIGKYADEQNMKATNTYNKLTKSVNEHQKALSKAKNTETNFDSLIGKYEKLSNITNKSKEQQNEYNSVLKELEKINPNLIQYDDNGNAIKVRTGEVKEYREELQKTIKEYEKLLSMKLEEKANASYDKNNSQPEIKKRNDELRKAIEERNKLLTTNPVTGISQSKLGSNWLDSYLKGDKETKKRVDDYVKQIQVVKDAEKKAIDTGASGSKQVNSDRTSYLENLFGNTEAITKAKDKVKTAIDEFQKLDFSQFDNDKFKEIGTNFQEMFSSMSEADAGKLTGLTKNLDQLNASWQNGNITSAQYKQSIDDLANKMHDLTGIGVDDAKKMLTLPEFDYAEANGLLSDIDNFKMTLESKVAEMANTDSQRQRLQLAFELEQDPTIPSQVREKIDELAADGEISDQDLETILNLQAEVKDEDFKTTVDEEIAKLGEMDEKEVTQEVAIKFAGKVEDGSDFTQYIQELTHSQDLAVDIKIAMNTGDLDTLKSELSDLPEEQQVGIIVAAASSGQYTPEQIQSFINTLPPEVQTAIKANDQASAIINNVKNNVNNVPESKNTNLNANDNASNKAITAKNNINNIPKTHDTSISAKDGASGIANKVAGAIRNIPKVWNIVISATQRVTKVVSEVHKALGGGRDNPGGSSVGEFTNISDTPVESNDVSATGTFSNVSSTPTESNVVSEGTPSAASSDQVLSKATKISNALKISTPKIDTSKTWESVKKGVDLFKELSERIDKVKSNLDLLGEKLERSVGKNRITLLKQQNKLYSQQAKLTKELYNKTSKSQKQITDQAKKYGFTIKDGFLDNYEETLLKLEKAAEDADKKLEDYNDKKSKSKDKKSKSKSKSDSSKEDSKQKALEKAAEKAKTKLEEAKKAADAFFDQDKQMADCQKDWEELQNKIKETKDEIEQLEFEDKIYKQKNAIEELNQSLESSNKKLEKYSTLSDRYEGKNKLKNLKLQTEELKKQMQYYKDMIAAGNSEIKQYQKKLKEYGVKFDKDKNISNYDEVLNKYQNSEDLDKIKDWIKEYQDLTENTRDWGNEIEDIINDTQDLNNEIKKIEFENKFKEFSNAVSDANQNMEKLNNELDILDVKLEHASGKEKIDLLDEQISKWEELIAQQKIALDNMKVQLNGTQQELSTYGFKFDNEGNIINKDSTLDSLKDNAMYDYIKEILEQWEELYNDKIPNAEKELINYQNSIKDIRDEQLDTIKSVEDKLKDMYKKQLEDRIDQIEKERDKEIEAIEKSRDARVKALQEVKDEYNRQNDTDDYNKQYEEQQNVINELNKKIALAQRDTSISGRGKLEELMEQLQEEQEKLQDIVNDRTKELTNQMFDDEIDKIEEKTDKSTESLKSQAEEQIKALEEAWTDSKIADAIKEAFNTGLFTDLDGNITSLEDAMIKFAEDSGEAVGILADKVKNELSESLKEAVEYMKDYNNIADALGFGENKQIKDFFNNLIPEDYINGKIPELEKPEVYIKDIPNGKGAEVKVGDINIEIKSDNGDPKAISQEIKKNIERYFKDILYKS